MNGVELIDEAAWTDAMSDEFLDKLNMMSLEEWEWANPGASELEKNLRFAQMVRGVGIGIRLIKPQPLFPKWSDLGPSEKALCKRDLVACGKTALYKELSHEWSKTRSYGNGYNGGKIDAARHAYWNALMTRGINRGWAISFSNTHEYDRPPKNQVSRLLQQMDFYNNNRGQDIGEKYPIHLYGDTQIQGIVKQYVNNGLMRVADGREKVFNQGGCRSLVPSNSYQAFIGSDCVGDK